MNPKVSIIVTSYNQSRTLSFLFESLKRQTEKQFEVVIADDGSSDRTESLCKQSWGFKINFVTQADDGYRKSKIVNEAIRQSRADYLIFLDGDVILEKHFVEDHLSLRKPRSFVCGRRVDLDPSLSDELTDKDVAGGLFDSLSLRVFKSAFFGKTENVNRSLRVTNPLIRKIFKYDKPIDILGSNFSCWKKDVVAVNGFNEDIESYWGEDGDLFIRLRNSGLTNIGAKAICVQFHVFHKRRTPTPENERRFKNLLSDHQYKFAKNGLVKEI